MSAAWHQTDVLQSSESRFKGSKIAIDLHPNSFGASRSFRGYSVSKLLVGNFVVTFAILFLFRNSCHNIWSSEWNFGASQQPQICVQLRRRRSRRSFMVPQCVWTSCMRWQHLSVESSNKDFNKKCPTNPTLNPRLKYIYFEIFSYFSFLFSAKCFRTTNSTCCTILFEMQLPMSFPRA